MVDDTPDALRIRADLTAGFEKRTEIGSWVNLAAMFSTLFVLVSFAVLPVKWTRRHYLGICLSIAVLFIELAFLIPLAVQPQQCHDLITPNTMRTNTTCAISGSLLIFGGWAAVIWVFWRALALHLQICWEVIPGRKFFFVTLSVGWVLPAVGLAITLGLSGVSYRFGNVCHINHKYGLEGFWGPLLTFATLGLVLQFITIGYCIHVYVRSLLDDKPTTEDSSAVTPTYTSSINTASARQAYRRVRKVVSLQWRGAMIVLLIIAEVVFFAIVFVSMDNSSEDKQLIQKATPWLTCLALTRGNKTQCLPQAKGLVHKESTVIAVLVCLGCSGFWLLIFLGRWSMVLGWRDFIKTKLMHRRNEFVSADATKVPEDPRTYVMLDVSKSEVTSPQPVFSPGPAHPLRSSPMTPEPDSKQGYFLRQTSVRTVNSPETPAPAYTFQAPTSDSVFTAHDWSAQQPPQRSDRAVRPGIAASKDYA